MAKELLQSAESLEAVVDLSVKKWQRSLALRIMTRISLDRLQNSQDCHQSILKKMQSYPQRKAYLHMHLPDVTLQESP